MKTQTKMTDNHRQQNRKHNRLSCRKLIRRLFSNVKDGVLLAKVLQKCHHNDGSQLSRKEALAICKNSRIARYVDLTP